MAAPSKQSPVGYECEFIDQVPEDYFCKQCSHVAREPAIATCCGETFCGDCINTSSQAEQPCPACQEPNINSAPQRKYKTKILALNVQCSLKDRGCEWIGQLQHLDAHLDLTTGDCVYVDVDCPSKCTQKVQKCNVDTHLANHCPNRDYTCPHCSFKATFHEVSEHFEVCRYYPLVCPNRCGASFERDVLEDHLKMCGLQKLQCEFSYAGCVDKFTRDHQKEHMEQNTQKHLALVAAATLRISQEQQQAFHLKFEEQRLSFEQDQEKKLHQKLKDKDSEIKAIMNKTSQLVNEQRQQSDAQIRDLQKKLQEQQQALEKKDIQIKKALEEQQKVFEKKLGEQREEFHKQLQKKGEKINEIDNTLRMKDGTPPYYFTLHMKEERNGELRSPEMYWKLGNCYFEILVQLHGKTHVSVFIIQSVGDNRPTYLDCRFTITLELLNQHRDQDHYRRYIECGTRGGGMMARKVKAFYGFHFEEASPYTIGSDEKFISHDLKWNESKQTQYLKNDCLKFRVLELNFV